VLLAAVYLVSEALPADLWSLLVTWPLLYAAIAVVLNAAETARVVRLAFLGLAGGSYALGVVAVVGGFEDLAAPGSELSVAYVAVALVLILRHAMSRRRVTVDVVFGALTAYVLIGILFAFLYTAIARADPRLFTPPQDPEAGAGLFYFSFVTLTTVGYGDIAPAADWVRSVAVLEGLTGQAFLVALVARLVSLEVAQRVEAAPTPKRSPRRQSLLRLNERVRDDRQAALLHRHSARRRVVDGRMQ
jgi:hypothetical protein